MTRYASALVSLMLLLTVTCVRLAAQDQITDPGYPLTAEVTDEMTENVWYNQYGPESQTEEFNGPTYFNTFFYDPNDNDGDGVVYSGIPDYNNYIADLNDSDADAPTPFEQYPTYRNSVSYGEGTETITTDVYTGDLYQQFDVSHELTYTFGSTTLAHEWDLTNATSSDDTVTLSYGGSPTLANYFAGIGFTTPAGLYHSGDFPYGPIMYEIQPYTEGFYALYEDPLDENEDSTGSYQQDVPTNVIANLGQPYLNSESGALPNTVNSNFNPQSYTSSSMALSWNVYCEGNGDPSITAYETWANPNVVTVQPSFESGYSFNTVVANEVGTISFTVTDQGDTGNAYYLLPQGTSVNGTPSLLFPGPITCDANGTITSTEAGQQVLNFNSPGATVVVTIPVSGNPALFSSTTASQQVLASLLVLSTNDPGVGDQDNGSITIVPNPNNPVIGTVNVPVTVQFTVTNYQTSTTSFNLSLAQPEGLELVTTNLPGDTGQLDPGSSVTYQVDVIGEEELVGGNTPYQLTITDDANSDYVSTQTVEMGFTDTTVATLYDVSPSDDTPFAATIGAVYVEAFTVYNNDENSDNTDAFDIQFVPSGDLTVVSVAQGTTDNILTAPFIPQVTIPSDTSLTFYVTLYDANPDSTNEDLNFYASRAGVDENPYDSANFDFTYIFSTGDDLTGPEGDTPYANVSYTTDFQITNLGTADDTYNLATAQEETIQDVSVEDSVFVSAGNSVTIPVTYTATDDGMLNLTATSQTTGVLDGEATDTITILPPPADLITVTADTLTVANAVTEASYSEAFTISNSDTNSDDPMINTLVTFLPSEGVSVLGATIGEGSPFSSGTTLCLRPGQSQTITVTSYGATELETGTLTMQASQSNPVETASGTTTFSYSPPSLLTGPGTLSSVVGAQNNAAFIISNQGTDSAVFTLAATPSAAVTITSTLASSVTVAGGSTATIGIGYTASGTGSLQLTLTSQTNSGYTGSATATITTTAGSNPITVSPPGAQTEAIGTTDSLTYTITNNGAADTFDLSTQATANISVTSAAPAPITLGSGDSQQVTITVVGESGTAGSVSLTATSATVEGESASGTTGFTFTPEVFTTPPVVVSPPSATQSAPGSPILLTFTVSNNENITDDFALQLVIPAGITVIEVQQPLTQTSQLHELIRTGGTTLQPVALAANTSAQVEVTVIAAPNATAAIDSVQLIATSLSNSNYTDTGTVAVTVPAAPTTAQPGAAITAVSPSVPVSTPGHIIYTAISPGTPQAVPRLLATLASLSPGTAVMYAFDATTQAFVLLPAQPTGGLLPTSGVFVASSLPLTFDLSGSSTLAPAPIVLQPGWNFIGISPTDPGTGTGLLTSHAFPADFDLLDGTGTLVTDRATFADLIGTVGSADPTSAEPFYFNGTTYTQEATLTSGVGYWMKNNGTLPITLQRVLSGQTLSAVQVVRSTSSATPTYTDRGTPPAPPAGASGDTASGSSGGCGFGAGVGMLLALGFMVRRRRQA